MIFIFCTLRYRIKLVLCQVLKCRFSAQAFLFMLKSLRSLIVELLRRGCGESPSEKMPRMPYIFKFDPALDSSILTVLVFMLCSCNPDQDLGEMPIPLLSPDEFYTIPLREDYSIYPKDLIFDHSTRQLSFFDHTTYTLLRIDFPTKKLVDSLKIDKEGPDGIGGASRIAHFISSKGRIFIFNKSSKTLFELDKAGKVRNKILIRDSDMPVNIPFPDARTLRPFVVKDNVAVIMGLSIGLEIQQDHTQVQNLFLVDMKSKNIEYRLPRPAIYNEGQWGALLKYANYCDYNANAGSLLVAMGLDHNIYEYFIDQDSLVRHRAKISVFPESFTPLKKDKDAVVSVEQTRHYGHTTPSYFAILYDPYKYVYYRFGTLGLSEDAYQNDESLSPVVAVLNQNFQKIGEYAFPKELYLRYNTMFVAPDGIHIGAYPKDKEALSFYRFNIPDNE